MKNGFVLVLAVMAAGVGMFVGCGGGAPGGGADAARCMPVPPDVSAKLTTSYERDIRPMFNQAGCLASTCHGGDLITSEYDQRSYESSFSSGVEARALGLCAIEPGNPDGSYLLEKLMPRPSIGVRMPNGMDPLTDAQIELVRMWIAEGAPP